MSTSPSKFSDTFLRTIPKLQADGRNWVTYCDCLTLCITAQGLHSYLEGTTTEPEDPATHDESASLTPDEVRENKEHFVVKADWEQKQAIMVQYIAATIPDSLYIKIKGKTTAKAVWDVLKAEFKLALECSSSSCDDAFRTSGVMKMGICVPILMACAPFVKS